MKELVDTMLNWLDSLEIRLRSVQQAIRSGDLDAAADELRAASYDIHDLLHELRTRKAA